jgi:hypothetical protein
MARSIWSGTISFGQIEDFPHHLASDGATLPQPSTTLVSAE